MPNWLSREIKADVRAYQVGVAGTPARRAIFLPGWDEEADDGCACVMQAYANGVIDRRTEVIAVERDPILAAKIEGKLRAEGFTYRMHVGDLATLPLDGEVDFAFFDFLGCLDRPTAIWLANTFQPAIATGATVSFTFAYSQRANQFMKAASTAFKTVFADYSRSKHIETRIDDWDMLLYRLLIASVFHERDYTFRKPIYYRDNVASMLAFRLEDMEAHPPSRPSLADVLEAIDTGGLLVPLAPRQKRETPRLTTRQMAAHKAWATRRRNLGTAA